MKIAACACQSSESSYRIGNEGRVRVSAHHRVGALALQHGQGVGDGAAQFAAVADEIDSAFGLRNSARWKPSGSLTRTVFSITRGPAKPIRALGSAITTSPREGKACAHATHGGVCQHTDVG